MPGKTEIRVTFGTRNKLPVLRENSVEVCDMIPAFLDQIKICRDFLFPISDQNMLFFLPYLRSTKAKMWDSLLPISDQNIRNFTFLFQK